MKVIKFNHDSHVLVL